MPKLRHFGAEATAADMKIKVGTRVQIFQDGEIIRERAVRQHASDLVATMVGAVLLVAEA